MKVYPVPGRAVRDPVTKHVLTEDGLEVSEHDIFWARRIRDEDVTTTAPAKAAATETKDEAPAAAAQEHEGDKA
jgi:hypothetical protein